MFIRFAGILLFTTFLAYGQQPVRMDKLKLEYASDLEMAGAMAKVSMGDGVVGAFGEAASLQSESFTRIYLSVPKQQRVNRLSEYLSAKTGVSGSLTGGDVQDFSWEYLAQDLKYSPVALEASSKLKLKEIHVGDKKFNFPAKIPVSGLVIPAEVGARGGMVTVIFGGNISNSIWTGPANAKVLEVPTTGTSQGCEIYVSSVPTGATVFFNGRQWHRATNIRAVQDPGKWDVVIRSKGYKEWASKRNFHLALCGALVRP